MVKHACMLSNSVMHYSATPWTVAHQAPLSQYHQKMFPLCISGYKLKKKNKQFIIRITVQWAVTYLKSFSFTGRFSTKDCFFLRLFVCCTSGLLTKAAPLLREELLLPFNLWFRECCGDQAEKLISDWSQRGCFKWFC